MTGTDFSHDSAMGAFPMSGRVSVTLSDEHPILFLDGEGPFNEEFLLSYGQHIQQYREQIAKLGIWGSLASIQGEALLSPVTRTLMIANIRAAVESGLVATALCLPKGCSGLSRQFWDEVYQESGILYHLFSDREEGLQWLLATLQQLQKRSR